jgi:hypothetical protein
VRTGLIRRVVSLSVATMMLSLVGASAVSADANVGPVVTAPADQTVSSQQAAPYSGNYTYALGTFSDPNGVAAGPWTWTVTWGDGSAGNGTTSSIGALSSRHAYLPGSYRAHVVVTNAAGASGDAYFNVTVAGDTYVGLASVVVATEGVPTHLDFGFYDPYLLVVSAQYAIHVDWGDGSSQDLSTPNTSPFTLNHTYAASDPDPVHPGGTVYTATVTVTDSLGHTGSASRPEPVIDVAPVLTSSPVLVPEGFSGQITLATFTDASVSPWQVFVDGGPGLQQQYQVQTPGPIQIQYAASMGSHTFTVYVGDRGGLLSQVTVAVTVTNSVPVVTGTQFTPSPQAEGSPVSVVATFADPGLGTTPPETYTCVVDYGDGSGPLAGIVSGGGCTGPAHTYPGLGPYTATVAVTDSQGAVGAGSLGITIPNTAPVITVTSGSDSATTGVAVSTVAVFDDPGFVVGGANETYTCTVDYGDGTGPQTGKVGGMVANDCEGLPHIYTLAGVYDVTVRVVDSNGGVGTGRKMINVVSAAPIVGAISTPSSVVEGTAFAASADFTPTGAQQSYSCTVDYGDGTGAQAGVVSGSTCQGPSHVYAAAGSFTITITVTGSSSPSGSATASITVTPPPFVGPISIAGPAVEGTALTASATFTPTGTQTYKCNVNYGDGTGSKTGAISATTCTGPSHKYGRPGTFTITVSVTGSKGSAGSSTKTLDIANVLPVFTSATLPSTAKMGSSVTVSASFNDPGTAETFQVVVDWGDGAMVPIQLAAGVRSFSASHTYRTAGDYSVVLELSDDQMAHAVTDIPVIAIYDPARTLTGSGTFASPAGACALSSKCAVASTATFTASASYAKGATKPTAKFTFSVTGLTFTATSFDWYTVTDGVGMLIGSGKVNGVSGYRFTVYTVDGTPDKIIVVIVGRDGSSVYNNHYTPLRTGSIVMR